MAEQQIALEADMIRQAQNGSQEAYRRLYERYTDAIYRYIHKRVGESCDAEDLTQAVFVKAWQALRDYQLSGAPFQAWLYRIAHNAVVDHYRTRRDPLLWDDLAWMADPRCTPENRVLHAEQQAVVHNAIAELRPAYREVIVRRFLYNMDYAETATELGQQVNNIRVLQHRALEALRRVLSTENALRLTAVFAILTLLLGGNAVIAAEQALPGDRLYPVRALGENVRLLLADDTGDLRLHTEFAAQRLADLATLYQQNRTADLATAVGDLAAHIRAASVTFSSLTQVQPAERQELMAQFAAALQIQSASLHTLAGAASPAVQTAIQPAINAFSAAQAGLGVHKTVPSAPAVAEPTPTVAPQEQGQAGTPATPTPLPKAAAVDLPQQAAPAIPANQAAGPGQKASDDSAPRPVILPTPTRSPPSPLHDTVAPPAGSAPPAPRADSTDPTPGLSPEARADQPVQQAQGNPTAANSRQNRSEPLPAALQPADPSPKVQEDATDRAPEQAIDGSESNQDRPDMAEQPVHTSAPAPEAENPAPPPQQEPTEELPPHDRPDERQPDPQNDPGAQPTAHEKPHQR